MSIRTAATLVAVLLALVPTACGSDGGSSDEVPEGARARALELLVDIGIEPGPAECMVEALGTETIIEAPDVAVLADGQPYQDAAAECLP